MPATAESNAPPAWFTAWLETQHEQRSSQFVEHEPEPKANPRVADPDAFSEFTRKLLEQTRPVPKDFTAEREPSYNIPYRWYLKPDGSFVSLQGDSKNRAMYQDKGFHLLDREEQQRYLEVERPNIIREQRHKANLITSLRKLIGREATLSGYDGDQEWDSSLDLMSIPRLEEEWRDLCSQTSHPDRKVPSPPRYRDDADPDARLLAGVETTPPASRIKDFEGQIPAPIRGQGRTIEVTHDNARTFA